MPKPIIILSSFHPKDDDFPKILGGFPSWDDAMKAASEVVPQIEPLDWVVHRKPILGACMHTIDSADTRYTIRELSITDFMKWTNPYGD